MTMKIIGLFPLTGNGGIASWTKKFIRTFPDELYQFEFIDVSPSQLQNSKNESLLSRIYNGLRTLNCVKKNLKRILNSDNHFDILHTTTSGNLGSFRDYQVARLCKRYNLRTIMHCRYGCITEDISSKGIIGVLLRKAMREFDQIWVLDTRSYNTLKGIDYLKDKVILTPNSIDVSTKLDPAPKEYKRIAFCGNLIPTKGIYELVEAATKSYVTLDIIGPGTDDVVSHIKNLAGRQLDKTIFIHGRLPNAEAVEFLKNVDIIALPTYYPSEAFPISILEAMSLSKLVISCPRAAIPDMLIGTDGKPCGLLVKPKSASSIVDAINWCQTHKDEADNMCHRAYYKVYTCYRKEVVYELYRENYKKLIQNIH